MLPDVCSHRRLIIRVLASRQRHLNSMRNVKWLEDTETEEIERSLLIGHK